MLNGHKSTKTLKALGPVFMALAFFAALAGAEAPNHLALMAGDLYNALEKKIASVPDDTKHGKILKLSKEILKKAYVDK